MHAYNFSEIVSIESVTCYFAEVFPNQIKLLRHFHVGLDQLEEEGRGHDGTAVQQGIVRFI